MTYGTVLSFDTDRGTGLLSVASGTRVPFSSRQSAFSTGDRVSFRLTGGIVGVYAHDVAPAHAAVPAPQRQTATSSRAFRWSAGTWAPTAG